LIQDAQHQFLGLMLKFQLPVQYTPNACSAFAGIRGDLVTLIMYQALQAKSTPLAFVQRN
jgi:hypothetical protein